MAACGISSCHEPIHFEDALERLRMGYWTMLREGSLRQDLEATLKPLIQRGINLQRLILVTDSMTPDDIAERGHRITSCVAPFPLACRPFKRFNR
ncbi:MAG: hypothetical protein ACREQV_00830 [Candidatus Binatia bacterium]